MKKEGHPTYYPEAVVTCSCGNTWTTGSTSKQIRSDVCSKCHPFFTGEQRIVDAEGQVDRFYKKLQARQGHLADIEAREAAQVSPERPLVELGLSKRILDILEKQEITKVGDVMERLEKGESALLDIEGFGRKSLADIKKGLRKLGYQLPEAVEEPTI